MNTKYDIDDLEKVANKEITVGEVAKKYGVSPARIRQSMNRHGLYVNKRIKIVSPYKTIYVQDKTKCAEELQVSRSTIVRALKGVSVPTLEQLGIQIMYDDEE